MEKLIVATRRSALALAQARAFMRDLEARHAGLQACELHVVTTGDKIQDRPLADIGGKGLFVKEIEEAILEGRADIAIHSLKDVPPVLAPGLVIGCIPEREDPRDALVTRSGALLEELPAGSKVGTSSLRRSVQLLAWRPDLQVVPLRGNVDTRLRKCEEGIVDAIVLACAGLSRLGLRDRVTQVLPPDRCIPAIGQGALGIELRAGDDRAKAWLDPLAHAETTLAVAAERGVMRAVEGNCQVPVAAHARREGNSLQLSALLADPDGTHKRTREITTAWPASAEEAERIGLMLGHELRAG
ncbi:MAG TPA: hydroxymethylbilane synthase [Polyangiaceae bacterium]